MKYQLHRLPSPHLHLFHNLIRIPVGKKEPAISASEVNRRRNVSKAFVHRTESASSGPSQDHIPGIASANIEIFEEVTYEHHAHSNNIL
jgi:hypothetical protein